VSTPRGSRIQPQIQPIWSHRPCGRQNATHGYCSHNANPDDIDELPLCSLQWSPSCRSIRQNRHVVLHPLHVPGDTMPVLSSPPPHSSVAPKNRATHPPAAPPPSLVPVRDRGGGGASLLVSPAEGRASCTDAPALRLDSSAQPGTDKSPGPRYQMGMAALVAAEEIHSR